MNTPTVKVNCETRTVTPIEALKWLEASDLLTCDAETVSRYVDTIIFAYDLSDHMITISEGKLVAGQNLLKAIWEADTPATIQVITTEGIQTGAVT